MIKVRIVLADDHALIRDGIKALLQQENDFEVVGEASNGLDILTLTKELLPDIVVLDLNMPYKNGIEVVKEIKQFNSGIRCIILSMHDDPEYITKCIQAGAKGYILKNADHEEIIRAVKAVHLGKPYYNTQISNILIDDMSTSVVTGFENFPIDLTSREMEVLREVASGQSTKMIADILGISARTVETHRLNLMKKLNAQNSAELIKIAIARKIIK